MPSGKGVDRWTWAQSSVEDVPETLAVDRLIA